MSLSFPLNRKLLTENLEPSNPLSHCLFNIKRENNESLKISLVHLEETWQVLDFKWACSFISKTFPHIFAFFNPSCLESDSFVLTHATLHVK